MSEFDEVISYRKDTNGFCISREESDKIEKLPGSFYQRIEITYLNNEVSTILLIGKVDKLLLSVVE